MVESYCSTQMDDLLGPIALFRFIVRTLPFHIQVLPFRIKRGSSAPKNFPKVRRTAVCHSGRQQDVIALAASDGDIEYDLAAIGPPSSGMYNHVELISHPENFPYNFVA